MPIRARRRFIGQPPPMLRIIRIIALVLMQVRLGALPNRCCPILMRSDPSPKS